jgi:hypothetical protein
MPNQEEISRLAHQLWEDEGRPEGRAREHWARAARMLESSPVGRSGVEEAEPAVAVAGSPESPGAARKSAARKPSRSKAKA